jgi:hypothetical protein
MELLCALVRMGTNKRKNVGNQYTETLSPDSTVVNKKEQRTQKTRTELTSEPDGFVEWERKGEER